jgi:hypothetical protein
MMVNAESPLAEARQEFCLALKTARERKGITLAEIAGATKIPAFHFAALERGDLRRWPKGLFRRSFFRDYAKMIGVPADACDEFARLFPDEAATIGGWPQLSNGNRGQPPAAATPNVGGGEANQSDGERLIMDPGWHGPRSPVLSRLLAAVVDAGMVCAIAAAVAWAGGLDRATTAAIVAITYFSVATMVSGQSPATWIVARRQALMDAIGHAGNTFGAMWSPAAPAEEPGEEARAWYSDAHRVGPPRLRVRIKMPH